MHILIWSFEMGPFTHMMYLQFEASSSRCCLTQRRAVLSNDSKELHPKLHRVSATGLDEKKQQREMKKDGKERI